MTLMNSIDQLKRRFIDHYKTAVVEYDLAVDSLKNWSKETDEITIRHLKACSGALFDGIENTLKLYCKIKQINYIDDNKKNDLTSLCNILGKRDDFKSIDLYSFVLNKAPRNNLVHSGRIAEIDGYSRVINNFYHLLLVAFPEEMKSVAPCHKTLNGDFDFEKFLYEIERFDAENCKYILICDPLHDIPKQQLEVLMRIPWTIVLDFDGRSNNGGFLDVIEKDDDNNVIKYSLPTVVTSLNDLICDSDKTLHISCEDKGLCVPQIRKVWGNKQDHLKYLISKTYHAIKPHLKLVCLKPNSRELTEVVTLFVDQYGTEKCTVLFLLDVEDDKKNIESICDNFAVFGSTPEQFCSSIYDYRNTFPEHKMPSTSSGLFIPSRNVDPQILNDNYLIENIEIYAEILDLDKGKSLNDYRPELFMRGEKASWEVFEQHFDSDLISDKKYQKFIKNIKDSFVVNQSASRLFYILHKPGFGGTTLGRRIAWDMHTSALVLVIKKFDHQFMNLLRSLYDTVKVGILLLVDDGILSLSDFEKLEDEINRINRPIVGVFVRRSVDFADDSKNKINLTVIKQDTIDSLILKCGAMVTNKAILDSRKNSLRKILPGDMCCPFLISLYILEEDFTSLGNYVEKFIKKITPDSGGEVIYAALRYISIMDYFSIRHFPTAFVQELSLTTAEKVKTKKLLNATDDLLLYHDKETSVSTRHFLIAEELMRKLFVPLEVSQTNDTWKEYIKKYSIELIDFLFERCNNGVDRSIVDIITSLFLDKTQSFTKDGDSSGDFSRIIEKIPNIGNERIDVLSHLCEVFDPYIKTLDSEKHRNEYAMLARIWANCGRYYSKSSLKNFRKAKECCDEAIEILNKINSTDYDVFHMAGLCCYEEAEQMLQVIDDPHDLITTKDLVDNALDYFELTRIYGSPNYGIPWFLRTVVLFLEKACFLYKITSLEDIDKMLKKEKWIELYISNANDLIDNTEIDSLNEKSKLYYKEYISQLDQLYYKNNFSTVLQKWNETLEGIMKLQHKDVNSIILARKIIIRTIIKKHEGSFIKLSLNKHDSERVLALLEENIELRRRESLSSYKTWFKVAKCCKKPISVGIVKANQWKEQLLAYESEEIDPYYYLYVLSLLNYLQGNSNTSEVLRHYGDCQNFLRRNAGINTRKIRDFYRNGSDMGQLLDSSIIDVGDVMYDDSIPMVLGSITEVDPSHRGIFGYIMLDLFSGEQVSNEVKDISKVFFTPTLNNITQLQKDKPVTLKFGFSYERLTAFEKSVGDPTKDVNSISDFDKDEIKKKNPKLLEDKVFDSILVEKLIFGKDQHLYLICKLNNRVGKLRDPEKNGHKLTYHEAQKLEGTTIKAKVFKYDASKDCYLLNTELLD